jgi:hypothetical protein
MVDLIGIKALAPSRAGSKAMRQLHRLAGTLADSGLDATDHVYAWNDSILLLSLVDKDASDGVERVIRDVRKVREAASTICPAYGIAVRGQTFPSPLPHVGASRKVTIVRASSWALANCFTIAQSLGQLGMAWYMDSRIVKDAPSLRGNDRGRHKVALFPTRKPRYIHVFDDSLSGRAS